MSDTDTRSVAEIMGWRPAGRHAWNPGSWRGRILPRHEWCSWCMTSRDRPHSDDCPDDPAVRDTPDPDPDDMLAWLRKRYVGVDIQVGASVAVEPWPNHRVIVGETLHAALEAAVRAVAADD